MSSDDLGPQPSTAPVVDQTPEPVVRSWITKDGSMEWYRFEPETTLLPTLEHVTALRPDRVTELYTLQGDTGFLKTCSDDGRSAHTLITTTKGTEADAEGSRRLAWYSVKHAGSRQEFNFFPEMPYTDELINAMVSYIYIVANDPGHDRWVISNLQRCLINVKAVKEVSDSFFDKARGPLPTSMKSWKMKELFRRGKSAVVAQQDAQAPFWYLPGALNERAVQYLAVAMNSSDAFYNYERMYPSPDIEGLIGTILNHLCAYYKTLKSAEISKLQI
jgi:hypothetical protein